MQPFEKALTQFQRAIQDSNEKFSHEMKTLQEQNQEHEREMAKEERAHQMELMKMLCGTSSNSNVTN
jgi:hypothetical protein